jgi:hypothetical protein
VQPWKLPDEPPLSRTYFDPVLPREPELPASAGVRVFAPNPEQTPPLPILVQAPTSRANTESPSAGFSAAKVLEAPLAQRTTPAPFIRFTLPDPFEHHHAVWYRIPSPDEPIPIFSLAPPGR